MMNLRMLVYGSALSRAAALPLYLLLLLLMASVRTGQGVVVKITSANLDELLKSHEVVFLNFYADWCRFSQMLTPIFEEASGKLDGEGRVLFGSVDCDREADVAQKYHINKYPTLKLIRNGEVAKREFRGQRSVDALAEFVKEQLVDSFNEFASDAELEEKIVAKKRAIIGYFPSRDGTEFAAVSKVASTLREECQFWIGIGDTFRQHTMGGPNIAYRPPNTQHEDQLFTGDLNNEEYLKQWVTDKCIPLVREITFENAEELTEEGLPFLILFRHPDDKDIVDTFTKEVAGQLADQKTSVNFLIADGKKFAHPLHHLGKAESDLPVLAIDSFRHMYLFPDMTQLTVPGKLRNFILDLHNGKLHREFHHGPDPDQGLLVGRRKAKGGGAPALDVGGGQPPSIPSDTTPPPSVFQKLKPSQNRYTILDKDEL